MPKVAGAKVRLFALQGITSGAHLASEWNKMMFAETEYVYIPNDDHLVVIFFKYSVVDDVWCSVIGKFRRRMVSKSVGWQTPRPCKTMAQSGPEVAQRWRGRWQPASTSNACYRRLDCCGPGTGSIWRRHAEREFKRRGGLGMRHNETDEQRIEEEGH